MTRWQEELGAVVGATVVEAARQHALATAFVATDVTGVGEFEGAAFEEGRTAPLCN